MVDFMHSTPCSPFSAFGGYLTRGEAENRCSGRGRGAMISLLHSRSAQASNDEAGDLFESVLAALESAHARTSVAQPAAGSIRTYLVT